MTNNFNILITSVGRRVSLVQLFQRALKKLGINGLVHAVDLKNDAPGFQVADKYQTVVKINDESYIEKLLEYCLTNGIKLVVPTIDMELIILSDAKPLFESNGIKLLVCSSQINKIFGSKKSTEIHFKNHGIPTPNSIDKNMVEALSNNLFPLILKPNNGSSSNGVTIVKNLNELNFFTQYLDDPIIQEYIVGEEYSIDVLFDFDGKIKCAVPRLRIETRAGEVSKSITVNDKIIIDWCYKIASTIEGAVGCVTIQCIKEKNGNINFIEINPRFGGGFPLSAESGADYTYWILQMIIEKDCPINFQNCWQDRCLMLRYDQGLFIKNHQN